MKLKKYRAINEAKISANDNYIRNSIRIVRKQQAVKLLESNCSKVCQEVPVNTNDFNNYFISSVSQMHTNNISVMQFVDNLILNCKRGIN